MTKAEKIESCKDFLVKLCKARFRDHMVEGMEMIFGFESKVQIKTMRTAQQYFRHLSDKDKKALEWFMKEAVDAALIEFFTLIDGIGSIDEDNEIELELFWKNNESGERFLLNDGNSTMFNEFYKSEDVTFMTPLELTKTE